MTTHSFGFKEEKARLIAQVLELQNTLDDLTHRQRYEFKRSERCYMLYKMCFLFTERGRSRNTFSI